MTIQISRVHFPVSVLGPGRRLGIWFQGCNIGCKGCVSRDTWSTQNGQQISISILVEKCRQMAGNNLDGVTITGGEPFEQPKALMTLLTALDDWRSVSGFDVLCYSGLSFKRLQREHSALLKRLDALIPEPFAEGQPTKAAWRGSDNQPLVILSDLGRSRYAEMPQSTQTMQVAVVEGAAWFIGIPRRGDLDRLQSMATNRGLALEDVSWNS